ncbi:MAG: hypothetical protein HY917_01160 [Candidatus Diapherotrites archaeon]|nr:hypothetical protein [Candidatus Diapherotrites archaeon]
MVKKTRAPPAFMDERIILEELGKREQTLSELHQKLRHQTGHHTVQALFKRLQKMVHEKKLVKKEKQYGLSIPWLFSNKRFFDRLCQQTARGPQPAINPESRYGEYVFYSLFEADNFWNELINQLAEQARNKTILMKENYFWWLILNMGFELMTWKNLQRKGFDIRFILLHDTPLNRWARQILCLNGFPTEIREQKEKQDADLNVFAHAILEAEYDSATRNRIRHMFHQYRTIQEIPPKTLTAFLTAKAHITIRVHRDPLLAKSIQQSIGKTIPQKQRR